MKTPACKFFHRQFFEFSQIYRKNTNCFLRKTLVLYKFLPVVFPFSNSLFIFLSIQLEKPCKPSHPPAASPPLLFFLQRIPSLVFILLFVRALSLFNQLFAYEIPALYRKSQAQRASALCVYNPEPGIPDKTDQ